MAAAASRMDELVKDYLLYRGLSGSLRSFENELKTEKEKGLRVDKIIDHIQALISVYDLHGLREYWSFLNNKFFSRLEQKQMGSVRKLEVGLLKYYLINASQNNRADKVREFFEVMTIELQNQPEFKEWFTFPFIRSPEENSHFTLYFTRQWQDTFFLSLNNFVSVMLQAMPAPVLLTFEHDQRKMRALREENESLKTQLRGDPNVLWKPRAQNLTNNMELMDDFYSISEGVMADENHSRAKSEKKFFNFPSSPLVRKKAGTNPKTGLTEPTRSGPVHIGGRISRGDTERDDLSSSAATKGPVKPRLPSHPQASAQPPPLVTSMATPSGTAAQTAPPVHIQPESRPRKTEESQADRKKTKRKMEEFDRQRKELFGTMDQAVRRNKRNGENSSPGPPPVRPDSSGVTEVTTCPPVETTSSAPPETKPQISVEMVPSTDGRTCSEVDQRTECPFLLLSQEEYGEHHSAISSSCFSNTGQYIVSSDVDGVVKVWTWSPQPVTRATIMSKSSFLSLSWASKTDRLLLLGNKSGNIKLFDVKDIKTICDVSADLTYPRLISLCCNPAGSQFVCSGSVEKLRSSSGGERSAGRVGRLSVWELKSMKMTGTLPVGPGPVTVNCSCYNHNGQLLLTGAADGSIRLFDMRQLSCISQWSAHDGEVLSLQLSPDETTCYSMGTDGKFMEWSINNRGRRVADLAVHPSACPVLPPGSPNTPRDPPRGKLFALDLDGRYVLTCSSSGGVIYERTTSAPGLARTMDLKGHLSGVTTVDWSPSADTRVCLTGAMDGKVKVSTLLSR